MHDAPTRHAPTLAPALARLVRDLGYPLLDGGDAPWRGDAAATWVVFLPGHGNASAETADIAVILPELVAATPDLRPAVADAAAERTLLERTGGLGLPALVFLRGDAVLGSIPRVRDWSDYRQRIAAILSASCDAGTTASPDTLVTLQ